LNGTIYWIDSNTTFLDSNFVALISCDPAAYVGYLDSLYTLANAVSNSPAAIILFSTVAASCSYEPSDDTRSYPHIYTTISSSDALTLSNHVTTMQSSTRDVVIGRRDTVGINATQPYSPSGSGTPAPGGPSPSTAVAMIILYSITGVITALFLIIIITGAVRAHRHPERYGPRNVLGRPRQSRARGLARAMLETLPIVKWGETDELKLATDVELGAPGAVGDATEASQKREINLENGDHSEASNTEKKAVAGAVSPEPPVEEEQTGCSICTDDFERGQDVRVLPCNHNFHPACIDPWLLNVSGTCPLWYVFACCILCFLLMASSRIDLRPALTANETPASPAANETTFPPPLDRQTRRQSAIWDILNPNRMEEASAQERIAALRHVREQRTPSEELEARRRRRLTLRLQDVFHIRTRALDRNAPSSEMSMTSAAAGAAPAAAVSAERVPESQQESTAGTPTASIANLGSGGQLDTVGEVTAEPDRIGSAIPMATVAEDTTPEPTKTASSNGKERETSSTS
jgi:hypothetical protein